MLFVLSASLNVIMCWCILCDFIAWVAFVHFDYMCYLCMTTDVPLVLSYLFWLILYFSRLNSLFMSCNMLFMVPVVIRLGTTAGYEPCWLELPFLHVTYVSSLCLVFMFFFHFLFYLFCCLLLLSLIPVFPDRFTCSPHIRLCI